MSSEGHAPGLGRIATGCVTLLTEAAAGAIRVRRVYMVIGRHLPALVGMIIMGLAAGMQPPAAAAATPVAAGGTAAGR